LTNATKVATSLDEGLTILVYQPSIKSISISESDCVIQFPTIPGEQYLLEWAPDLISADWTTVPWPVLTGNGGELQVMHAGALIGGAARFYRLRLVP